MSASTEQLNSFHVLKPIGGVLATSQAEVTWTMAKKAAAKAFTGLAI